jgi:hypothetical protein
LIDESTEKGQSQDMLHQITKLSNHPHLVYYERTTEMVNVLQALVTVGEVDAVNCCVMLDKQEGTLILKGILNEQPTLVQEKGKIKWECKQANHDKKSDESGCDKAGQRELVVFTSSAHPQLMMTCSTKSNIGHTWDTMRKRFRGNWTLDINGLSSNHKKFTRLWWRSHFRKVEWVKSRKTQNMIKPK